MARTSVKKSKIPAPNAGQRVRGYEVQSQTASELRQFNHKRSIKKRK